MKYEMKTDKFYEAYSVFCHTVTNPIRLKIIDIINKDKLNVSEIQQKADISMSNLSNHLSALYKLGILGREKKGNFNYYFLVEKDILKVMSAAGKLMEKIFKSKHVEIIKK